MKVDMDRLILINAKIYVNELICYMVPRSCIYLVQYIRRTNLQRTLEIHSSNLQIEFN